MEELNQRFLIWFQSYHQSPYTGMGQTPVKQILKTEGKIRILQGGSFSPLAANIYLNEMDWYFDGIRSKTMQGSYEAVKYHRFAADIVITLSGHHTKRG
jgi:RNA-directed DNA polymerase